MCVLGSRSGPGVSLSGAVRQDGDEECCPESWKKLGGGGIVNHLAGDTPPAGKSMPV